jgi:hypothetical protein
MLEPDADEPVHFVRVPYDIQAVTNAIRRSALPDEFAADLEAGGMPAAMGQSRGTN